jgi:peptidoglycan hydrolase CwlO-like protein
VLKTLAIEAVAPPWFAPVQQQLNNMQQQLNNIQEEQNNIRQQLNQIDTKASRVCPYPPLS